MWHPPERIRHAPPEGNWPTEATAKSSLVYQPMALGAKRIHQRTWVPAMVPWRATEDGFVTDDVLDWYGRFAQGRPGVLVVEATGIRDIPSGPLLRIGHPRFVPGLRSLVERVKEESHGETRLLIQLIDFLRIRRRPEKQKFFGRFLKLEMRHRKALASLESEENWLDAEEEAVRNRLVEIDDDLLKNVLSKREMEDYLFGYRERVWDTELPHIQELPKVLPPLFAHAAENAEAAGFDGVELHYAHAYTMASFLSALNTRDDEYGGDVANRARLPLEVISAVKQSVSSEFVVGLRFLGDDVVEGGNGIDDAKYFGLQFAKAGVDYLSVSKGGKFEDAKQPKVGAAAYPYTGKSGYECMPTVFSDETGPFGRNVYLSAVIRERIRGKGFDTPIVTSGGICTFDQADEILRKGQADIIAAARQTLADPDWFLKMRLGKGAEIIRCEFTNYCEGIDQKHKQVTCKLWDRQKLDDKDVKLDTSGKRRLTAPKWTQEESR